MASLFYEEDRNSDFLQVCESVRKEGHTQRSVSEIAKIAIYRKAKSFYIQPRVFIKIIRNNGKHLPKNEVSRELHLEVLRRAGELMSINKDYTPPQIANILEEQEAPRFYISEARAESLYYTLLK